MTERERQKAHAKERLHKYWENKNRKQTNADRIRSMTDEELAVFLSETTSNAIVVLGIGSKVKGKTVYDWYEWLKEEVEDG